MLAQIGHITIQISEEDAHLLTDFGWSVKERNGKIAIMRFGHDRQYWLHRVIFGAKPRQHVVFLNGDTLDFRRENLADIKETRIRKDHFDRVRPTYPSPFSPERLREIYWREGGTVDSIRAAACQITGKRPDRETVDRWLKEGGISKRTHRDVMLMRHRREPDKLRAWRLKGVRIHAENVRHGVTPSHVEQMHTKPRKRRAKEAWLRNWRDRLVIVPCRRRECSKIMRRSPSWVSLHPNGAYCSHRCSGLDNAPIPRWLKDLMEQQS